MTTSPWQYYFSSAGGIPSISTSESAVIDGRISWFSQQYSSAGYPQVCAGTFSYTQTPWLAPTATDCRGFTLAHYTNGVESRNSRHFPVSYSGGYGCAPQNAAWCIDRTRDISCPAGYTMTGFRPGFGAATNTPSTEYCAPTHFVSYTLALAGMGTEIEPSGTVGGGISTRTGYVSVMNAQTNQPKDGAVVRLTVNVDVASGGHDHGEDYARRPRGTISGDQCTTTAVPDAYDCTTASNGYAQFTFNAPEASGTHSFTATCVNPTCTNQESGKIDVKVDGLNPIPDLPSLYALKEADAQGVMKPIGARENYHTDNHNMTSGAAQKLLILAAFYHATFPNDPVLYLNDASLPWGGVYDICARPGACATQGVTPWVAPHKGHRRGTVVDVRANGATSAIPQANYDKFIKFLRKPRYGINATFIPEDQGTPNGHFHVMFAGHQE